jgi:tetratricopeptide (TPR) repeat protein
VNDAAAPPKVQSPFRRMLLAGVRPGDLAALGDALGVPAEAGEAALAAALVRALGTAQADHIALGGDATSTPARGDDSRVVDGRASFLMRLTSGGSQASVDLGRIADLRTLMAVVRAGNLRQRRAATLRIGELLAGRGQLPSEQVREAIDMLVQPRAFAIAYEAYVVCVKLPGADGRRARAAAQQWQELSAQCEQRARDFWDGEHHDEPIMALPDDQRVQLLMRTRDLSDEVVRHLCALISGNDGGSDRRARVALIGALLNAGDARLLPALRSVVEGGDTELLGPAARALGRIDDPRAHAALKSAYERTAAAEERLLLAGALGIAGDSRGHAYVREVLAQSHEGVLGVALEALAELGSYDDVQSVSELLWHGDPAIAMAAVQTLGRIGDARALLPLDDLLRGADSSALRAAIEDAQDAIRARMELLGEEPPASKLAAHTFDTAKRAAIVKRKDPAVVRLRAQWSFALGQLWLALGASARAVRRFEQAAALRADWAAPVVGVAIAYSQRNEIAQALASFRRALAIERSAVENNGAAARMLAQAFLRRAEAMARDGREDIARGLLEEALSFDLRRAPSDLRFAIEQRLHALKVQSA